MMSSDVLVDIHGSCVSYYPIHKKNPAYDTWKLNGIKSNLYYVYCSIPSSVTEPISVDPEEYDFDMDKFFKRNLISDMKKQAVPSLLQSEAKWLFIDLYDWTRAHEMYDGGCFAHTHSLPKCAPQFCEAAKDTLKNNWFRWIDIPYFIWSANIDKYMDIMINKYGSNILINRVNMNKYYIDLNNMVNEIDYCDPKFFGGFQDNSIIRNIEDSIIDKWNLLSIDISKYYITDVRTDGDMLAVHYERDYYRLAGKYMKMILDGHPGSFDVLDAEGAAFKWKRYHDLGPVEGSKYISAATIPKTEFTFMDDLLVQLDIELLREIGYSVADIYLSLDTNREYFLNENIPLGEKQKICLDLIKDSITKMACP